MSSDLSQLMSQLLRIEHGQTPQILSISGPSNQTSHPGQGALSSDGPNTSQRFQVANSNVNQVTFNFNFIGNSNLGSRAITNGDNGAYLNHQDSQSTAISYARPSMTEAADQVDFNPKLAAVKESTVKVRRSTEEVKGSLVKLVETTATFREWTTARDWPTFKLGLVSEQDVTLGDFVIEQCMPLIKFSQMVLEFGQLNVEHGESIVRDSDSIMTVGEPFSLVVFDTLTVKLGEAAATFRESRARFLELALGCFDISHKENARKLDNSELSRLRELMTVASFPTFEEMMTEVKQSAETVCTSLDAFGVSMVAYAKALAAPKDLIVAFDPYSMRISSGK